MSALRPIGVGGARSCGGAVATFLWRRSPKQGGALLRNSGVVVVTYRNSARLSRLESETRQQVQTRCSRPRRERGPAVGGEPYDADGRTTARPSEGEPPPALRETLIFGGPGGRWGCFRGPYSEGFRPAEDRMLGPVAPTRARTAYAALLPGARTAAWWRASAAARRRLIILPAKALNARRLSSLNG